MPEAGSHLEFKDLHATMQKPLILYYDFESKLVTPEEPHVTPRSTQVSSHLPIAYSVCIVDSSNQIVYEKTECSETDCMSMFFSCLDEIEGRVLPSLKRYADVVPTLTESQLNYFLARNKCCICREYFGENYDDSIGRSKVVHHDHYTNEVYGLAHHSCNLRVVSKEMIVAYAHNSSSYDKHFLCHY